ncbi:YdcH family protein [Ancylobacter terrae]|uniref:YdcH family protein n=1 Tax=Ancylobacter sp. sgz301288 TaxID=3342077 RepID=UPI00385D4BFD
MSMQAHVAELQRRHQALERELREELAHPGSDETRIADLKRRKLLLKDEIVRLTENQTVH